MPSWTTKLIHSETTSPEGYVSLAAPVFRGSTTVFPNTAAVRDDWHQDTGYTYGLYGTPTAYALAARITELERGERTLLTPSGQAAIALIYLSLTAAGDHVLVPDSVYGPNRELTAKILRRLGVEVEYYPPLIGAGIERLIRPTTRLLWCESPGSITMEVQDVPAIVNAAHRHGAIVALDNTYAAGIYFDAFAHKVDVTMQALTKYIGGHSDLLLGSVTVRSTEHYERLGATHGLLGFAVSPDECSLALRGLQTLSVRLQALESNALRVAQWLAQRQAVTAVLHPAFPSCPGHEIWQRDFTGSTSIFSVVFREGIAKDAIVAFVDALTLFKIGYSWGGVTSLALPCLDLHRMHGPSYEGRLVRFNIGLEDVDDLIQDLDQALHRAGLAGV